MATCRSIYGGAASCILDATMRGLTLCLASIILGLYTLQLFLTFSGISVTLIWQDVSPSSALYACHATWSRVGSDPVSIDRHADSTISFNSYTQQICIDDAVVVDEQRPENVVTNDGTTMRIMAQKSATPSAWTRQKEVIVGAQATAVLEENARKAKAEVALIDNVLDESVEGTHVALSL